MQIYFVKCQNSVILKLLSVQFQEALAQICEYSEAGITVRGTYILPNKEPKEGERKLYLGIEATNELAVSKAKAEITRLIKEELVRLVSSKKNSFPSMIFVVNILYMRVI